MAKKTTKKTTKKSTSTKKSAPISVGRAKSKFNLFWLRIGLGLLFLAAGIPKLLTLFSGRPDVANFFTSLGIPAPAFFAWAVAIIEVVAGLFLVIGFLIWWSSLLLAIIVAVAGIMLSLAFGFDVSSLLEHFVFFAGLVALMLSKDTSFAVDKNTGWKQPRF
ncbi:MAG: DoxX family protein [Candidatus Woesearchaeota archaeon]